MACGGNDLIVDFALGDACIGAQAMAGPIWTLIALSLAAIVWRLLYGVVTGEVVVSVFMQVRGPSSSFPPAVCDASSRGRGSPHAVCYTSSRGRVGCVAEHIPILPISCAQSIPHDISHPTSGHTVC